jgi:hypothetical protein
MSNPLFSSLAPEGSAWVVDSINVGTLIRQLGSVFFPGFKGQRYLAMLAIYLSDIGTEGDVNCFMGGFIASVDQWAEFSDEWSALCDALNDGKLVEAPASIANDVAVKLAQCIVEHIPIEVWCALPRYYLDQVQQKHGIAFDKYRTCLLGVFNDVLNDWDLITFGDKLAWTFLYKHEKREIAHSLLRAFQDIQTAAPLHQRSLVDRFAFSADITTPPLQAAAFFTWHLWNYHSHSMDVRNHPAYEVLRTARFEKRIEVVWFDHKLEKLLSRLT